MKVIYKYPIGVAFGAHVYLNEDSKVLGAVIQGDEIYIYAIVEPEKRFHKLFIFHCYNTGQFQENFLGEYLDTVTSSNGIVWHIFVEEIK